MHGNVCSVLIATSASASTSRLTRLICQPVLLKEDVIVAYYFHLEPEYCVLSGGIWYPKPEILKVLRREIYNNIDEFVSIIEEPSFKALYPSLEGDMLKRIPAGFPSDSPYGHILRHKDFSVIGIKPDSFFSQPDWMEETIDCFRKLLPFNRFLNEIVDEYMGNL